MACYAGLIFSRALYLGDPWPIAIHQLQDGALLLFAFFMITDPKTTPAHTTARALYAAAIALMPIGLNLNYTKAPANFMHWRWFALWCRYSTDCIRRQYFTGNTLYRTITQGRNHA